MNACVAEGTNGGRCRNTAQDNDQDGFCSFHIKERDSGKPRKAGMPGKVLVKANINPRWMGIFMGLGIQVKVADFAKREADHVAHAKQAGRNAYAIRKDIADSGVPVFGKDGLENVLMYEPLDTMLKAYHITDMHIFQRRDHLVMNVLCITFERGVDGERKIALPSEVAEFFALSKWGYAHIWANPPKDGVVVHTVNLSHRSDEAAQQQVLFANGLWAVDKVAS